MAKNRRVSAQYREMAYVYPEIVSLHSTKGYRKKQMTLEEKCYAIQSGDVDELVKKNLLRGSQCPFV